MNARQVVLEIRDLFVEINADRTKVKPVNGVSFAVREAETLVILGESGSGKSITGLAVMGLLAPEAKVTGGEIWLGDTDLQSLDDRARRSHLGTGVAMVFQDSLSSLNPTLTVGYQIAETILYRTKASRSEAKVEALSLMHRVGIAAAEERYGHYPHQFSGGMRQRVMIAIAIALRPRVLIADEPTTALDVTVQAQIMALLADLQSEYGMALVLITHDLGVAADIADRVAVMYAGKIVETTTTSELFSQPAHPYTAALLASMPQSANRGQRLSPIIGSPPSLASIPEGCSFHPRCAMARARCSVDVPTLETVSELHETACHYHDEVSR